MPDQIKTLSLLKESQRISEGARSLLRVLHNGRLHETPRATNLRRYIIKITEKLAECCDSLRDSSLTSAHLELLTDLRRIVPALVEPSTEPAGIRLLLGGMAEKLMPGVDFVLDTRSSPGFAFQEVIQRLKRYAQEVFPEPVGDSPDAFFKIFCPKGEQDNVLNGYSLVRSFLPEQDSNGHQAYGFVTEAKAAWVLGPAYLFALSVSPRSLTHLAFVAEELNTIGWKTHPVVGTLLQSLWKTYTTEGLSLSDFLQQKMEDEKTRALIEGARAERETIQTTLQGYTPDDFDKEVPHLWDRLRQLLPPNEIETGALDSPCLPDVVSIMNAGWTFYLLHIDELYQTLSATTEDDRYEARQALNRLLIKGIELSEIARRWRNVVNKEN